MRRAYETIRGWFPEPSSELAEPDPKVQSTQSRHSRLLGAQALCPWVIAGLMLAAWFLPSWGLTLMAWGVTLLLGGFWYIRLAFHLQDEKQAAHQRYREHVEAASIEQAERVERTTIDEPLVWHHHEE